MSHGPFGGLAFHSPEILEIMSNESKIYKVTVTREYIVECDETICDIDLKCVFEAPLETANTLLAMWDGRFSCHQKLGPDATVEFQHLIPKSCPET